MRPEVKVTMYPQSKTGIPALTIQDKCSGHDFSWTSVRIQGQRHSDLKKMYTFCHPKVYPHTKFWIPTSNYITDRLQT